MAENLADQLARVRSKASILTEKYVRLKEAYEAERRAATGLRAELKARDAEIEQLRLKVEYLSIASTVKMGSDDVQSARAMLADLVREIDRCIADLE